MPQKILCILQGVFVSKRLISHADSELLNGICPYTCVPIPTSYIPETEAEPLKLERFTKDVNNPWFHTILISDLEVEID